VAADVPGGCWADRGSLNGPMRSPGTSNATLRGTRNILGVSGGGESGRLETSCQTRRMKYTHIDNWKTAFKEKAKR